MIVNATCPWGSVLCAVYSLLDAPSTAPAFYKVDFFFLHHLIIMFYLRLTCVFIRLFSFFDSLILCYVYVSVCLFVFCK